MPVNTSRRALFGGAGLIAVAALAKSGGTPAYAATVDPRLRRAIALRDFVEAQCDRLDEEVEMPARRAHADAVAAHPAGDHRKGAERLSAIEARSTQLAGREYHLWQTVVTMPANSLADVAAKLTFVERASRTDFDGFVLQHIAADVRRLIGEA